MAKADWENEDFEPKVFQKHLLTSDRWEGEDEDDDVKDNWDDEDEEEKDKDEQPSAAVQPKKKKSLAQIIAEKEEKKKKELEEKLKQSEEEKKVCTPEEVMAEKLRQQKLQEEADLELAKETFGVTDSTSGIDAMNPSTKDEFDSFRRALVNKISRYDSSAHYLVFLEDICRDLCLTLQYDDIKKITSTLNALATEKLKAQKASKSKKKSKKVALTLEKNELTIGNYDDYDEFEDCI